MILGIDQFGARLKAHYDKVMAFVVLLLLVSSLIYLGVKVGLIRQMQADFNSTIRSLRPQHPTAAQIESTDFDEASSSLKTPFKIKIDATNSYMFVPETRFSCRDCRLPVPINAKRCPFCNAVTKPTVAVNPDSDADGIPTVWEEKYNLDPYDATDAAKDNDGDGYSNLVEYQGGYDPTDPKSHPAAIKNLKLVKITGEKFGFQFKSRAKTRSGYLFGINYRLPNGETKTDFVAIGDTVAGVFTVIGYKEKFVEVKKNFPKEDRSELTVKTEKGDIITLVKGKAARHVKLTAHMVLVTPDGKEQKFDVSKKDEFKVDGIKYRVIDIDGDKSLVLILDVPDKKKIKISK